MTNPTTPFNWQMPTATDLVTDLPADFEVFGQAVATSMADLLGGTTGQILAKASNTNMDFTWVTNDVGDITAVTAGTGISGGGTSGAVTITNTLATAITTAGDTLYGTGAGTVSRLGIGSSGQVLTVAAGVPSWSTLAAGGGWTSIASGNILNEAFEISSITGAYKNLRLVMRNMQVDTAATPKLIFNSDGSDKYTTMIMAGTTNTFSTTVVNSQTGIPFSYGDVKANSTMTVIYDFPDYANTTSYKTVTATSFYVATGGTNNQQTVVQATYRSTSAITYMQMGAYGIAGFNAGTYILYGGN